MRKGVLSLIMPSSRKNKRKNIVKAEQAANIPAEPVLKEPVPAPVAEEPFVQKVYVPKPPSLLKTINKKHDEMVQKARRRST